MIFLYNSGIWLYGLAIRIAARFSPKAKAWVSGRQPVFEQLRQSFMESDQVVWMHCASLGEFEQGRPVIEKIKTEYPNHKILLTFFSPSGYQIRKDYKYADLVCYLPEDTSKNARRFLSFIKPKLAIFVKYDLWYHYLKNLHDQNIPTLLISAIFYPKQIFFKWHGSLFRKMLGYFTHIFVQNKSSEILLGEIGITPVTIAGDNRIDRVVQIATNASRLENIEVFINQMPTIIFGSTWPKDEQLLFQLLQEKEFDNYKFIVAPHDVSKGNIQRIVKQIPNNISSIKYSTLHSATKQNKILIIDNIGLLSTIYQYGQWAYIGGAFKAGLHNTLEPITFGLPVVFGPKYHKFTEAVQLVKDKGAFSIKNYNELYTIFTKLKKETTRKQASGVVLEFLEKNKGATKKVFMTIQKIL